MPQDTYDYDVIVVGSGAAGGQTAYTLTMDGAKVLMLEAGRNYVPETPRPDAQEISKDDIVALSKFGFFSITSTTKTTIYVDNVRYGETPMQRLPLPPGPHKVKAVTKGKKAREFMITIIGGRDTEQETIEW